MAVYSSRQGETLDLICHRFYGSTDTFEAVLAANPHLANLPPLLPIGTRITLPAIEPSARVDIVQLWD